MIVSRTPYRISFFGGGTDYPAWYRENEGAVLSTTIDRYCYLTVRPLPPFWEYATRIVYSRIELVNEVDEIRHPAVREAFRRMGLCRGLEIHHHGDLPARAGLGASSAFAVGLLHSLHVLQGRRLEPLDLARLAIRLEQEWIGETVGSQDQVATAVGGLNHITFGWDEKANDHRIDVRPVRIEPERTAALESHLLLYFTGVFRSASEVAAEQVGRVKENAERLRTIRAMVEEGIRILQGEDDIEAFGRLLHEAWLQKRGLGTRVSTSEIDSIYEEARRGGAIGGKLLGAGGGGFLLLFVRPRDHRRVRERLRGLVKVPVRFESWGSQIMHHEQTPV